MNITNNLKRPIRLCFWEYVNDDDINNLGSKELQPNEDTDEIPENTNITINETGLTISILKSEKPMEIPA